MVDGHLACRPTEVTAGYDSVSFRSQAVDTAHRGENHPRCDDLRAAGGGTDVGRKKDAAELARREREEWQLGQDWARWLLAGNAPQALTLYGIVLGEGE